MIDTVLFGAYPYIALTVFLAGSWLRFDTEQYTWKTDSSQLLSKRGMRLASNLFHVGVLAVLGGHAVGLLTPHPWFRAAGVTDIAHQWMAIGAGSVFGLMCLLGGLMLLARRLGNRRVRAAARSTDLPILVWLLATLTLGLCTIPVSVGHAEHGDAGVMIALAEWVQSILCLHPQPGLLAGVEPIFKAHITFGLTVLLVFPFTRLVHIWSVPLGYLGRAYQVVRTR